METDYSYWNVVWQQFKKHRIGFCSFFVVILFAFIGLYAPFFASSKPIAVNFDGHWYFPLFRYLFYPGFYTKPIDLFYNLLMFTLPTALLLMVFLKGQRKWILLGMGMIQMGLFLWLMVDKPLDPASSPALEHARQQGLRELKESAGTHQSSIPTWDFDLRYKNDYAKLNMLLREHLSLEQHQRLLQSVPAQPVSHVGDLLPVLTTANLPSMWNIRQKEEKDQIHRYEKILNERKNAYEAAVQQLNEDPSSIAKARQTIQSYLDVQAKLDYLIDRREWLSENVNKLHFLAMPLVRPYHWEDDAGGTQNLNQYVSWWDLTRINRKDLVSALIFGIRISLVVGITAVIFALAIGIPLGSIAGYFGGKSDLFISRLMEIWEAMPIFFMLLFVVAIVQSKSIFLVVAVLGIFGWISIARFIRGEVLKQRNLTYVDACHSLGFKNSRIIFSHILPNAIPPVLTLLPFAIMGAIISEAGLSFLGLGEEGSSSWGVLMDEGRTVFPAESYLLWPPALLLTLLLVAIALVGDALRDAIDPKMR